jgi:hypothetical protein
METVVLVTEKIGLGVGGLGSVTDGVVSASEGQSF